ncbi:MAG: hypothetical protein P1U56_24410 [Saprospiraceae bacterium]|nr:hypothetical protein [Saprospiraceae bacterium]
MTDNFKVLSDEEFDKLKDAISLITVYIAGADGKIDSNELEWAEKVTSIRSYSETYGLKLFYEEVGLDFNDRVSNYILTLDTLELRNSTVEAKLAELNPILKKLDPRIGAQTYKSLISFAKHVAKASGGFLGFFSIGPDEKAVLDLKMIEPIVWKPEEDEEENAE